ncbi:MULTISPECIES: DUF2249 domain-containing protein [unclassified Bradyrhizobium]|uniref:DUF2249 domain-containing protein n=1 Tax=unclassified Bradyrhizobium TaxID=2631580 RepID=UPI00211EB62A|nr:MULTISPECIES: DUF2249 domain-containing protein [unclassified Bradyrhizobium]MDD1534812.1 universal stress protein [Bradyrhizobium sp. WBOS8]MDD1584304.1 universal stress protein [Bradyrhizobium sp. WBOS4]UUO50447.1 universal stress protein [Bradyrhizobium sp. WBOS04]UUO57824.1 universal stress protein [Bradyrhizobium sp. WBOS08]
MTEFIDVDVRPILRAGGEPFSIIMATLERLAPGEGLRLYAPFKPVPLFDVMASRGFAHRAAELEGGEWEIRFMPDDGSVEAAEPVFAASSEGDWPEPAVHLDNRDLDPPEPMVRILAALERLAPGQTLSALLSREPVFLFRELTKRGHQWRGAFTPQKDSYQLTVRVQP